MERLRLFFIICSFYTLQVNSQHTIERIGDVGLISMPLVSIASTFINHDKEGLYDFSKAFALNTVLTLGLKEITNKKRPNGEDFKSFPSGHTSITFQGAAFMQKRYGWKYGIPAYIVAGYTGFSRVYAKKHYVEDVVAGAAFGIISSYIFTEKLQKQNLYISFEKTGKSMSFSYVYNF